MITPLEGSTASTPPRRHRGRGRGQSTVEFAISSIVILLLMSGLLDLSRVFFFSVNVRAAAREGARHGAWFNAPQRQNPYLDDTDIKTAVDQVLGGAGLPASTLRTGCPGSSPFNAPYPGGSYGATGQVTLFICYDALGSPNSGRTSPPGPDDISWAGKDLDVIVLYNYPFITGFLGSIFGSGIPVAANEHISIQGHP